MIDRSALLGDLQKLLTRLEKDLLDRSESDEVPEVGRTLRAEYARAQTAERTAQNYEDWRRDAITQHAAAWVLSAVFVRFLEDNSLIDPPRISGPRERLQRARDEHELYFRQHPKETDRDYLLKIFDELAGLPGTRDVFGGHNPLRELPNWLSPDAAGELLKFFQKIDAGTGELLHDFTDPEWDTRFLGDLYQDLSEAARKKYALLQTPEFVEEFILDRTLDPAIEEFGLGPATEASSSSSSGDEPSRFNAQRFRMIDPACGSGHFLLGAFRRIFDRWRRAEPGTNSRALVQRSLESIYGADLNPYAIAIARFRLLLAALRTCGIARLRDAPGFTVNLACGDSLLHTPLLTGQTVLDFDLIAPDITHTYSNEDLELLKRYLRRGQYHAVVANPPYIRPSDPGLNTSYRRRFVSCHGFYALTAPFMELLFQLSVNGGFVGQITGNSFMNNEFGSVLVHTFLPSIELTSVLDTRYITPEGHGTPTVILFGRNRRPVGTAVRTVVGTRGDYNQNAGDSSSGIWDLLLSHIDSQDYASEFFQTLDLPQSTFHSHPWMLSGSNVSNVTSIMSSVPGSALNALASGVGIVGMTNADDVMLAPKASFSRRCVEGKVIRQLVAGDAIRDWVVREDEFAIFPYENERLLSLSEMPNAYQWLWPSRTYLGSRSAFGNVTYREAGRPWWEWHQISHGRLSRPNTVTFAYKATHNHFAMSPSAAVFNRTAPVVIFDLGFPSERVFGILGLLNSSAACFWERTVHRQVSGAGIEPWETRSERNITKVKQFHVPTGCCLKAMEPLASTIGELCACEPRSVLSGGVDGTHSGTVLRQRIQEQSARHEEMRRRLIAAQEELDWECYQLYGLVNGDVTVAEPPPLNAGQRAFEFVLARKMTTGETKTTWFERHGSIPITELPADWPDDYRELVERRIELIETDPNIRLIEQPEYKRRWNTEPWESQLERALREWLLDRLERYFDFDGRMNDEGTPTAQLGIEIISLARLADIARTDAEFQEVGALYRSDMAFDVQNLLEELIGDESVPLLAVLRYTESGLRKRIEWEENWNVQRREDAGEEFDTVVPPPEYTANDFQSKTFWRLRGKLDVPKERWVSFPHCDGPDGTPMIAWAGYDHLQLARAVSEYFVEVQEKLGGREDSRLPPLLAGLAELVPWLKQWHNTPDPAFNGQQMGDYFEGFIQDEARQLGKTVAEVKAWTPPAKTGRGRKKKGAE